MSEYCEHGAQRNRPWPPGFSWMEGTGTCGCCGTIFCCWYGHIPEDRCKKCGGREMTIEEASSKYAHAPDAPTKTLQERLADYKASKLS